MIPKKIHYCWFGRGPMPEIAKKCISSWKKYCKDYEIIEWNEDNFDININDYVKEAYENNKFAFVTDYARLWILYNYGGLYFDVDVEIIKSIDDLLDCSSFFGSENNELISTGLGCGCEKNNFLVKKMMDDYKKIHFKKRDDTFDLTPCPVRNSKSIYDVFLAKIKNKDVVSSIDNNYFYPKEYFCPISTKTRLLSITDKTYSIHHYAATWTDQVSQRYSIFKSKMVNKFGVKVGKTISYTYFLIHPKFFKERINYNLKKK